MIGGWIVIGLTIWLLAAAPIAVMVGRRLKRIRREQSSSQIWLARRRVSALEADEWQQHDRCIDRDVRSAERAHGEDRGHPPVPEAGSGRRRLRDPEPPPGPPMHY